MIEKDSEKLIGVMGFHKIDTLNRNAGTGSNIGLSEFRGKGLGTEAKLYLLEYAFKTLGLHKVRSSVIDYNQSSIKSLEKCGYEQCGVRKEDLFRDGALRDLYLYEVFRPNWEKAFGKWKKKHS
jgi:RimJ/RimL family protein N-acetyltransferase